MQYQIPAPASMPARFANHATLPQQAAGLFAGLTVVLPLCGRFFGIPGRFYGVLTALVALVLIAPMLRRLRIGRLQLATFGLVVAFALLVVGSASEEQWTLLFSPQAWSRHASLYAQAKLLNFLLSFGPTVAVGMAIALLPDRKAVFQGIAVACVFAGVLFLLRVLHYAPMLIQTDYITARPFYVSEVPRPFSLISGALVMTLAALGAYWLRAPKAGPEIYAVSVFLFAAAWFAIRSESIVLFFLIMGSAVCFRRLFKVDVGMVTFLVLCIGVGLVGLLRNGVTQSYWSNGFSNAIAVRAKLADTAVLPASGSVVPKHFDDGAAPTPSTPPPVTMEPKVVSTTPAPATGLGSFANRRPDMAYPHNLFVEIYDEIGPLALAALLGVLVLWVAVQLRNFWRRQNPYAIALSLMGAGLLASAMKAGDITNAGNILFFVLASLAVPAAKLPEREA